MTEKERAFIRAVRTHAKRHGRSFPWRDTYDPYRILVSEIMLQQTQTDRVIPKYKSFLKRYPRVRALARAPLGDVLREWSGLGYNRRAKMLHACAKAVVAEHKGKFPDTYEGLLSLPGVGPYTAGAVLAFAFNKPHAIIETNIRTVYLHHFYPEREGVTDRELMHHIEATLDHKAPRQWYAALMDYGAWIKKHHGNHNIRSRSYVKQSKFKGSAREARGAILRTLTKKAGTLQSIFKETRLERGRIEAQLASLKSEGLIEKEGRKFRLP